MVFLSSVPPGLRGFSPRDFHKIQSSSSAYPLRLGSQAHLSVFLHQSPRGLEVFYQLIFLIFLRRFRLRFWRFFLIDSGG